MLNGNDMEIAGLNGLIKDVEFAFVLPFVGFVLALINIKMTPRSRFNQLKLRLSLSFVILLFVCLLSILLFQDRAVLKSLWQSSPLLYSLLYFIGTILVIGGLWGLVNWKLQPMMWRKDQQE